MPVKVYDRPERPGLSPILIAVGVIALLVLGFFVYQWRFASPAAQPTAASPPARGQSSLLIRGNHRAATTRHSTGNPLSKEAFFPSITKEQVS